MLDTFTQPETVTCVLCRATVSIRKGDKARFFNHISLDHEVHYDMDLFYVVSFLTQTQRSNVIDIISGEILGGSRNEGNQDSSLASIDVNNSEKEINHVEKNVRDVEDTRVENYTNDGDLITRQGSVDVNIEKDGSEEGKNKAIDKEVVQNPETSEESLSNKPMSTENSTEEESSSTTSYLQILKKFYQRQSPTSQCEETNENEKTVTQKKKGKTKSGKKGKYFSNRKEKCKECTVMVSRKNMKRHIQMRHKKKPSESDGTGHLIVPCSFCEKRLRKDSIAKHMTLIHKINSADQRKIRLEEIKTENVDQTNMSHENMDEGDTQQSNDEKQESSQDNLRDNIAHALIKSEKIDYATVILKKLKDIDTPKKEEESKVDEEEGSRYKNCNLCQKDIKIKYYKKHLYQTHAEGRKDKEVDCELCSIKFSRLERLKGHFNSVHKDDMHLLSDNFKAKFEKKDCKNVCKACNMTFITKSSLNYHESRKHGTGSFACQSCNHRFSSRWYLRNHQKLCNATT